MTRQKRSGPRKGRSNEVPPRTHVTAIVTDASDVATFIALSGERDLHLALRLRAWRDGYATAAAETALLRLEAFSDGWQQGYRAGFEQAAA